jgi:phospho-N-acetylmuramoyl-pentapeptide-transferase
MNTHIDFAIQIDRIIPVLWMGALSFVLAFALTPVYTFFAYRYQLWKKPRTEAITGEKAVEYQKLHAEKHRRHIPTMAGVISLVVIAVVTLCFNLSREQTYLPLAAFLGAGLIGLLDDAINIRGLSIFKGLRSSLKFNLMLLVAVLGACYFYFKLDYSAIGIPFLEQPLTLGILIIPFFTFVVLATANAVNITDGLDGLAGGLLTSAFSAFGVIAFLQGSYGIAAFCATAVGALQAYTWFNVFPARFFMGDTGAFAFGATLGVVAMLTNSMLILPIIGIVFVFEAGSSFLQIASKRILKRKIFRVAPIHHHFEAIGWPETKVTMRFWIIGQLAAALGVCMAAVGGLL